MSHCLDDVTRTHHAALALAVIKLATTVRGIDR